MLTVAGEAQSPTPAAHVSQTDATADLLKEVDLLIQQNQEFQKQNQELMRQIHGLRQILDRQADARSPEQSGTFPISRDAVPAAQDPASAPSEEGGKTREKSGKYTPNFGYRVAFTEFGDVNISILAYVRYLNQRNLDPTYTNASGATSAIQQRQDVQLNKVQIKFLGWVWNPKLRYYVYAWTNNAAAGLPGSIYLAGNVYYDFAD